MDRVTIYGFVKDVENLMMTHDVGIVRGSPNVLMECITCTLPVIITGTLPGQEEGNIDFILGNKLGLLWHKKHGFINTIDRLLRNDRERLIEIKKNQLAFRDLEAAKKIVDEFEKILKKEKTR
jgi:processive 1,2-diacylglycerol beta-glucosyltransferase